MKESPSLIASISTRPLEVLNSIKGEFKEQTWEAFQGVTLDEKKPREVAEELDMTVNAVFIAKSRVLSRLRNHGQGLIDI